MKTTKKIKIVLFLNILISICLLQCKNEQDIQNLKIYTITESFQTERNEADNIDSPAVWHGRDDQNWLISTAKKGDALVVNDASDGRFIKRIGSTGTAAGFFKRPNGIFVIDSLALIVERDNHRLQVMKLPDFKSLGFIGDSLLLRPYGLFVYKMQNDKYAAYVTDCYESENEEIPANHELGRRVHHYLFKIEFDSVNWELVRMFGDTTGNGMLRIVESIYGDPVHNHLLIAEEEEIQTSVKIYDLGGNFTGQIIDGGIFKSQVEGIALYENEDGSGYWIITDQDHNNNLFHIFDRINFTYIASFRGKNTTNTDGIWITQKSFNNFPDGAFYAVHNDGNVSTFDWKIIADSLGLNLN